MKTKITREQLKAKIKSLTAQLPSTSIFGKKAVKEIKDYTGSGLIIDITDLSGKRIAENLFFVNGFDEALKQALIDGLDKSIEASKEVYGFDTSKELAPK